MTELAISPARRLALAAALALATLVPATEAAPPGKAPGDRDGQVIIREWVPAEKATRPKPRVSRTRRARMRAGLRRHSVATKPRATSRRRAVTAPSSAIRRRPAATPARPAVVAAAPIRGSASALNLRAYRLLQRGRHTEAEPLLRRALALRPGYAYALYNLGWSLVEQGRAREALAPLRRTAALQPGRWEPQQRLADAYAVLGDQDAAASAAARAHALRYGPASRRSRR
jgi:predicted Zn-dependent protease